MCFFGKKLSQNPLEQGDGMLRSVDPVGCRRCLTVQEVVMGLYMMLILWNLLFLVAWYIIIFQEFSKHIFLLHAKSYQKLLVSFYLLCYSIVLLLYCLCDPSVSKSVS